jgi:uridine kinase
MKRTQAIEILAGEIARIKRSHPVRVAIDGVDAAGKTTLADELVGPLEALGCTIIRASIDGFHNPRVIRYQAGGNSPEGYYRHSFDHKALKAALLDPLGPGETLLYRRRVFDFKTDHQISAPTEQAKGDEILLFDGVFLLRPELAGYWDYAIFVDVSFETSLKRAMCRDRYLFGDPEEVRRRYIQRYIPGQQIYLRDCQPKSKAHAVLGNDVPANPTLRFNSQIENLSQSA